MNTELSEEELMVRDTARRFLEGACPTTLVRAMEKDKLGYSVELWAQACELGWPGLALAEEYGGSELPLVYMGLVMQEVGRTLAPIPLASTVVAALALARGGHGELQSNILPKVASGEVILTWAMQETDPRIDLSVIHCEAKKSGDGFLINGVKMFVDMVPAADYCVTVCRTGPDDGKGGGLSLFLVDLKAAGITDTHLVTMAKDKHSALTFDNVKVGAECLIGTLHGGGENASMMFDQATLLLCAQMLGAARKDLEIGVDWAKTRVAFGAPIATFQALQHLCVDGLISIDGGELLTYEALWRMDQGKPASIETSQAKSFCSNRMVPAVRVAQTTHGGMGFMMECDLQLWYRRVAAWTMRCGSGSEHRARIASGLLDHQGDVILGQTIPVEEYV